MRHATISMRHTLVNTIRGLLMLVAMVGTAEICDAQNKSANSNPAKINLGFDKDLPAWLREANVPAAGVAIIENGKLVYAKIFGELKRGTPSPQATPTNAIFQVASLTKPVVEVLTLRLVSAGQWKLDEPLATYWIDPDVQNDPRHKKLTTRHV